MNDKRSHERFRNYLDSLDQLGKFAGAARQNRLHPVTARRWSEYSKRAAEEDDRSVWFLEWRGEEAFFHEHLATLLKAMVGEIQHGLVVAARDGTWTPSYLNGVPVHLPNPEFEETTQTKKYETDFDLWLNDLPTRWLRDENFKKIPAYTWSPPTSERQQLVLGSFTRQFARRLDVSHDHNVHGGVLVVGKPQPASLPSVQTVEPVEATASDAVDAEFTEQPVEEPSAAPAPAPPPPPRDLLTPMQRELIEQAKRK
jgi:hypothetical protein